MLNVNINSQLGTRESDILVTRVKEKAINVECKLAKNDSFAIKSVMIAGLLQDIGLFRVKCMRSRTVSDNETATRMSADYGIPRKIVLMHADNYREQDFDFVVASLGNAFWTTINGKYEFNGTNEQFKFLKRLFPKQFTSFDKFQEESYNFLLIARSKELIVSPLNRITCSRKRCKTNGTQDNCGFIPNYPLINLNNVANGIGPWKLLCASEKEFDIF